MSPLPYQNVPSSNPYAYQPVQSTRNWPKIILVTLGIIILVAAVYLGITYLTNKVQESSNNLNITIIGNDSGNGSNQNPSNPGTTQLYDCGSDSYNCGNFTTQQQAQSVFDYCTSRGYGDVNQLDKDGNGKACESLLS